MSFDSLGLRPELLRAVQDQDYSLPTSVQTKAIPAILQGRDLIAAAQTGSGKTAGFTLPMLQRLMERGVVEPRVVRALVLVPTRELCAQVNESVRTYGAHLPLKSVQIFGGVGMQPQIDALVRGVDIVIATPGRLLDHVQQRTLSLKHIEILVLDEADRMLDMGFIHDIRRILGLLPKARQNLLFSATFADEIKELADQLLNKPEMIQVTPRNRPVDSIEQEMYEVDSARKVDLLVHLFTDRAWDQALVFTRTKHGANRLTQKLVRAGISAEPIHGNKSQSARTRALARFKATEIRALVATDIAARGLDIDGLPQVVNYDLPQVAEDYVHRIGRTGRAGADGHAISLVSAEERGQWRAIEKLIKRTVAATALPAFSPLPTVQRAHRNGAGDRDATATEEMVMQPGDGEDDEMSMDDVGVESAHDDAQTNDAETDDAETSEANNAADGSGNADQPRRRRRRRRGRGKGDGNGNGNRAQAGAAPTALRAATAPPREQGTQPGRRGGGDRRGNSQPGAARGRGPGASSGSSGWDSRRNDRSGRGNRARGGFITGAASAEEAAYHRAVTIGDDRGNRDDRGDSRRRDEVRNPRAPESQRGDRRGRREGPRNDAPRLDAQRSDGPRSDNQGNSWGSGERRSYGSDRPSRSGGGNRNDRRGRGGSRTEQDSGVERKRYFNGRQESDPSRYR